MTLTPLASPVAAHLDPEGVIGADIESGHTLPSSWYTDPEVFRLEQAQVFRRAWEYVGHAGQVARSGDFFSCEVSGVPVVVVCGKDLEVRAFVNICRHRHNPVAVGSGNRPLLTCHYHAWSYELDGSFKAAPRSNEDPSFDGSSLCLKTLPLARLGEMIFVNASGDAPPLEDALGPIPDLARSHGIPLDSATFRETRSMVMEANWKLPWDNNVECYHCATVHRSWYRKAQLDPEHVYSFPVGPLQFQHVVDQHLEAATDNHFYSWPAFCLTTDSATGAGFDQRSASVDDAGKTVWPNLPNYFIWKFVPVSPTQTRLEWHLFAVDSLDDAAATEIFDGLLSVVAEDKEVCEGVQRSHNSGAAGVGTLIPAIDSEFTTLTWERLLYRALTQPTVPLYAPILEPSDTWPSQHAVTLDRGVSA